jgi:hypothetical protein
MRTTGKGLAILQGISIRDEICYCDVPTLTDVFPSSSDARLPPCLLLTLNRLLLLGGRYIML